jgi:hypothetical protein
MDVRFRPEHDGIKAVDVASGEDGCGQRDIPDCHCCHEKRSVQR